MGSRACVKVGGLVSEQSEVCKGSRDVHCLHGFLICL